MRLRRLERLARFRRSERDRAQRDRAATREALSQARAIGAAERQRQHAEQVRFAAAARSGALGSWLAAAAAGLGTQSLRLQTARADVERAERADTEALQRLIDAQSRKAGLERGVERERERLRRERQRREERELDDRPRIRVRALAGTLLALALLAPTQSPAQVSAPDPSDTGVARLLEDIRARQQRLELRELEVTDRERSIAELEAVVLQRLAEAEEIAAGVERRIVDWEDAHEAKSISRLAKIYGSMDSARAAGLLEDLDLQLATRIVAKMKPRESAELLPLLSAPRALAMSRNVAHPLGGPSGDQEENR